MQAWIDDNLDTRISEIYESPALGHRHYRWMWGDAGQNLLGHKAAEMNTFRWSSWVERDMCLSELQSQTSKDRPVTLAIGKSNGIKKEFASVDETISFLNQADPRLGEPDLPPTTF